LKNLRFLLLGTLSFGLWGVVSVKAASTTVPTPATVNIVSHATTTLQPGTTVSVRLGRIDSLYVSSLTLTGNTTSLTLPGITVDTITWRVANNYKQSFPVVINVKDPPYNARATSSDNTTAFQTALNALPSGGKLYIPVGEYIVKSQLDINSVNRITIEGENSSESVIKFLPSGADRRLFLIDGGIDNATFRNFGVTNSTTATGTRAFVANVGASQLTWDGVYFTDFNRQGIDLAAGVHYAQIRNCRFLRTRDTTSTFVAIAILAEGNNYVNIQNNRFSQNDVSIQILGGTTLNVLNNTF